MRKRTIHIQEPKVSGSAHDQLDQLCQQVGAEGMKLRELDVALEAAKREVEDASSSITNAYADGDEKLAAGRRTQLQKAEDEIVEVGHRRAAAQVRLERAQQAVSAFTSESGHGLLEEREAATARPQSHLPVPCMKWFDLTVNTHRTARASRRSST
jgi:hypothetical protein